jgi:hypothetical protein
MKKLMLRAIVVLIKMVELENHDYLIQPAACGQGIVGSDSIELRVSNKITDVYISINYGTGQNN